MSTFSRLGLPEPLVAALSRAGITEPFPIQTATLPDALAGRDVSGKAPTGSGKTLAFGLGVLATIGRGRRHKPAALVLAPTRELAEQIRRELVPLAKAADRFVLTVHGGVGYGHQESSLRRGVDMLVATPGRLEDLIDRGSVDLSEVDVVVLDEADRMADMGFLPVVRRLLDQTSPTRQTLLFSATLDGDVASLVRDYQRDPVRHEVAGMESEDTGASHHFWLVDHHERVRHTADVVGSGGRTIVFTRTRHGADRLAKQLGNVGVDAVAMHGGRSQGQRNRAISSFSTGRAQALVATDVAARGIHVDDVASVVHYDPPADHKDYVHRSGRTARAGASGTVVSLVTADQRGAVKRIQKELGMREPIRTPGRGDSIGRSGTDERPTGEPRRSRDDRARPTTGGGTNGQQRRSRDDRARPSTGGTSGVYVANLPWSATERDLAGLFDGLGEVSGTTIVTDRRTGRSRGFGFVDLPTERVAAAVEALTGTELDGRPLTVRPARPRR